MNLKEERKHNAAFMQQSAQSIEHGSIGIKTVCELGAVTEAELSILKKAEAMALKAANVTRRIANRMEQVK